jgi:hypothetical protein
MRGELDGGTAVANLPQREERLLLRRVEFDPRWPMSHLQTGRASLSARKFAVKQDTQVARKVFSTKPSSQHDGIAAQSAMLYTPREGGTRWTIKK